MAQQEENKRPRARVVRALKGIVDCLDDMASEDRHRQDSGWQSWGDSKWADDLIQLPGVLDRATRRRIGELRAAAISAFTDLRLHRILADTQRVGVQLRADPPKRPLADARKHAEQVAADLEELACEIEGGGEPVHEGAPSANAGAGGGTNLSKSQRDTLAVIVATGRNAITQEEIAESRGLSVDAVRNHTDALKAAGAVKKGPKDQGFLATDLGRRLIDP